MERPQMKINLVLRHPRPLMGMAGVVTKLEEALSEAHQVREKCFDEAFH
jgi:hypothetical protein